MSPPYPKILVARKSTNVAAPAITSAFNRLSALGFSVLQDDDATLEQCRLYDVIVVDAEAWAADEHNAFIQELYEDGQRVIVTGNDSNTGLFYVTATHSTSDLAHADDIGIAIKDGSTHPIWDGVTTLPNDTDAGRHITAVLEGALRVGGWDNHLAAFSIIDLPHKNGGRVLHLSRWLAGGDADLFARNVIAYMARPGRRELAEDTRTAVTAERGELVHLVELDFDGGLVRLATAPHDIVTEAHAVRIGASITRYLLRNPVGTWPATNLTFEAWVRLDSGLSTAQPNVVCSYSISGSNDFSVELASDGAGHWKPRLWLNNASSALTAADYPDDNAWHHLVVTWRSSDGRVQIFVDGVLTQDITAFQVGYVLPGRGAFVLGQDQDSLGGGFDATQALKGLIDGVRFYGRVLEVAEVVEHFAGVFRNDETLRGHWSFDRMDKLGYDLSPAHNDLTVFGITAPEDGAPVLRREWEGVGGLIQVGTVEETNDARSQGVDLNLSGVDQTILAVLLSSSYRGRDGRVYRAHLDLVTGQVLAPPMLMFKGLQLDPYTVEEERDSRRGGTVRIKTRLSGIFGHTRARGIQSGLASHQHHFPGDLFFQHTVKLANRKIYWGTAAPTEIKTGVSATTPTGPPEGSPRGRRFR